MEVSFHISNGSTAFLYVNIVLGLSQRWTAGTQLKIWKTTSIRTGGRSKSPILCFISYWESSIPSSWSSPLWLTAVSSGSSPRKFSHRDDFLGFFLGVNPILFRLRSRTKGLLTASNILIVNLACCDFLMMIKNPVFIYNCFHLGPVFGLEGCKLFGLLGAYVGPVAAMTNAAIAFDRYR